ncbi:MAG: DUF4293 domain-containing protein [Paludibacteraceae bacterium]|nr:DUF4293 domain-containing protein [Paludibacteraceae bacterium]
MIQRIQTVYLSLAVIASILLCCIPPMTFMTDEDAAEQKVYAMDFRHLHEMMYDANDNFVHAPNGAIMDTWALTVLAVAIGALCFVDIFLYRRRILQARLNVFTMICALGYYALLAMYAWFAVKRFDVDWYLEWTAVMPIIIVVLLFIATRRILADEALVRSADRLRR